MACFKAALPDKHTAFLCYSLDRVLMAVKMAPPRKLSLVLLLSLRVIQP